MRQTRRDFLEQLMRGGAGAAALMAASGVAQAHGKTPNIVFFLVDDLGWADLPCYGNGFLETPNIDRLAAQGLRFTDAYAACPVCSPTRASIMSGQYPAHVGVTDFIPGHWRPYAKLLAPRNRTQYLPHEIETVAESLKKAGYTTGAFGKWHLGGAKYFPKTQGFDEAVVTTGWGHFANQSFPDQGYGEEDYLSEVLTDKAEAFIKAHKGDPFFLYLAHFGVHIPLEARDRLVKKYEAKAKAYPDACHPTYAAMIEHIDESLGRVLDTLDAQGLTENTLLVFFSDNGGLHQRFDGKDEIVTSNAPLRDEKGSLYEGGIREPLLVRWPGVTQAGGVCAAPVSSVDFYPSFLEAAGAPTPDQPLDGVSLLPLLQGGAELDRDAIFWHYPHYHHSTPACALRAGDWKLIHFFEEDRLELYNLREDIGEKSNLAEEYPDRAAALKARLDAWRKSVNAAMPSPNPDYDPARAGEWGQYDPKKYEQK